MIEVVPFLVPHYLDIDPQPRQAYVKELTPMYHVRQLEESCRAFTLIREGRPVACFGSVELYPHRAVLWALLDKDIGKHMVTAVRVAKRFVQTLPHKRIEFEVDYDFAEAHRWAKLLGFTCEVERLRCHNALGGDTSIYSVVR